MSEGVCLHGLAILQFWTKLKKYDFGSNLPNTDLGDLFKLIWFLFCYLSEKDEMLKEKKLFRVEWSINVRQQKPIRSYFVFYWTISTSFDSSFPSSFIYLTIIMFNAKQNRTGLAYLLSHYIHRSVENRQQNMFDANSQCFASSFCCPPHLPETRRAQEMQIQIIFLLFYYCSSNYHRLDVFIFLKRCFYWVFPTAPVILGSFDQKCKWNEFDMAQYHFRICRHQFNYSQHYSV